MNGRMFTMENNVGSCVRQTKVLESSINNIQNNLNELICMVKTLLPPMNSHQYGAQPFNFKRLQSNPLHALECKDHQILVL
jgi:hypothetical protein